MPNPIPDFDYPAYLRSARWAGIRRKVKERDGWCCQYCGTDDQLEVHHVHYRSVGRENGHELVTLCRLCHESEHEDARKAGGLRHREALWKSLRPCPLEPRDRMRREIERLTTCPACGHDLRQEPRNARRNASGRRSGESVRASDGR